MNRKNKSHSGAKKRFKLTATGKIKRHHAGASHLLTKKSPKRRRKLRAGAIMEPADRKRLKGVINN